MSRSSSPRDEQLSYEQRLAAFMDDDEGDEAHDASESSLAGQSGLVNGHARSDKGRIAVNGQANGQLQSEGDEDEEEFFYSGTDRRKQLFGSSEDADGEEDSDADVNEAAVRPVQSYADRLKDALGSDDEALPGELAQLDTTRNGEEGSEVACESEEEAFTYPGSSRQAATADESFMLPDITVDSVQGDTSWTHSTRRVRPAGYPTLSRLRAAGLGLGSRHNDDAGPSRPGSLRLSSTGSIPASIMAGTYDETRNSGMHVPSSSASSISQGSSRTGRKRRRMAFPYGPSSLGPLQSIGPLIEADGEAELQRSLHSSTGVGPSDASDLSSAPRRCRAVGPHADLPPYRWSAIRKLSPHLAAMPARQLRYGPDRTGAALKAGSVLAVGGGLIAVGRADGTVVVHGHPSGSQTFLDHEQARSAGPVTALAISSDHTYVAVGHDSGHLMLYDLARPTLLARHVSPVQAGDVFSGRKEGHLVNSRILHLSFVGTRHTAIVSADEHGLAFYHSLGKILGVSSNDTLRMLGRYPEARMTKSLGPDASQGPVNPRSTILGMSALPLGPISHFADQFSFVALVTSSKLVVVSLKPTARTWYRRTAPSPGVSAGERELNSAKDSQARHLDGGSILNSPAFDGRQYRADLSGTGAAPNHEAEANSKPAWLNSDRNALASMVTWYPATGESQDGVPIAPSSSDPLLAHSFGNHLFVTALRPVYVVAGNATAAASTNGSTVSKTELQFADETTYTHHETIIALQWLSREHLFVLGSSGDLQLFSLARKQCVASQHLTEVIPPLVLREWRVAGSPELRSKAELADGGSRSLAPSAAHSMRSYKGQLFILTTHEVVAGTALSWADHLLSFVSKGDFLGAVDLATAFYTGARGQHALGLPDDVYARKSVVGGKLRELMRASVQYAFSPERLTDSTHVTPDGRGVDRTEQFQQLAASCAEACVAIEDLDLLFSEIYDAYADNGIESIFAEQLELFIVTGRIRVLPIPVVQRLVAFRQLREEYDLAERIIWHVDPACLDIDQALSLCLQQRLWDALIYVYNSVMDDYVAPIVELMGVLKAANKERQSSEDVAEQMLTANEDDAYKIFSYLSVILAGRSYPSQEPLAESRSVLAKRTLYSFLFSGRCVAWPPGPGGQLVFTQEERHEPTYPYLRLFLDFDAEAFLDALDVAFEDSFLDGDETEENSFAHSGDNVTRQLLISVLLEIIDTNRVEGGHTLDPYGEASRRSDEVTKLSETAVTFCCLFVARNAPKYPQFIRLRADQVVLLLTILSTSMDGDTREDRQLGVECLLSLYKIEQTESLLALFEQAGFVRVLQKAYRSAGKWNKLVTMLLHDPCAGNEVFGQLNAVLSSAALSSGKAGLDASLQQLLLDAAPRLAHNSPSGMASLVDRFCCERHGEVLAKLHADQTAQLEYLRSFAGFAAEPAQSASNADASLDSAHLDQSARHLFVSLVADLEPGALVRSLSIQNAEYFDLRRVIEIGEEQECYDAVFWALCELGERKQAFQALDRFVALEAMVLRADDASQSDASLSLEASSSAEKLRRLVDQVVDFCKRVDTHSTVHQSSSSAISFKDAWLHLLQSLMGLMHGVAAVAAGPDSAQQPIAAMKFCRALVRDALASLVSSTSADAISFPDLFRKLALESQGTLDGDQSSGRMYAEVRTVLEGMLDAYQLRIELLGITNRLFDRDVFTVLSSLTRQRRRGWRPKAVSQTCNRCGGPLFADEDASKIGGRAADAASRDMETSPSPTVTRMRRKSSVPNLDTIPSRPASPLLQPAVSPRPDKGKGVARPLGDDEPGGYFTGQPAGAGHTLPSFASISRSMSVSSMTTDPSESFSALPTPRLGFSDEDDRQRQRSMEGDLDISAVSRVDRSRRLSTPRWTKGFDSVSSPSSSRDVDGIRPWRDEIYDEQVDKAVVVLRTGEAWHRRCAPFAN
ncbi:Vacuolar assembly/sorting protein VPS8 [Ceraceosorus bombacis]|uniref:Vacuolar assembly/sorting protein VPS8 n=1 Tax=Ceraceosorus bombacis TaxID=401625 RepID=A0A0P1BEX4_9BASI|nr:Vacuolar assembly/sorting protein VPS8 [Ceraceosorus bombacis]